MALFPSFPLSQFWFCVSPQPLRTRLSGVTLLSHALPLKYVPLIPRRVLFPQRLREFHPCFPCPPSILRNFPSRRVGSYTHVVLAAGTLKFIEFHNRFINPYFPGVSPLACLDFMYGWLLFISSGALFLPLLSPCPLLVFFSYDVLLMEAPRLTPFLFLGFFCFTLSGRVFFFPKRKIPFLLLL